MKADIIIAIDPDTDKAGVACIDKRFRTLTVQNLTFVQVIEYLQGLVYQRDAHSLAIDVVVEASWNTKHNWHALPRDSKAVAAAKGYAVGANHTVGKLIVQMAEFYGFNVVQQLPLRKCWKGPDRKITNDELNGLLKQAGIEPLKRSNQEIRDSVLICLTHGNLI